MKPEEKARQQIDDQLRAAGWTVQTRPGEQGVHRWSSSARLRRIFWGG